MIPMMNKHKIRNIILDFLAIFVGSIFYSVSVNMFSAPNNIAPGGATGIATMINYATNLPIGVLTIAINVPILIWAAIEINIPYVLKTGVAVLVSSVVIDIMDPYMIHFTDDTLLAAVFGGVLGGIGIGLIFMRGATTGGTDLAATLLGRHIRYISIGKLILATDLAVVLASAIVYKNLLSPMYAVIYLFIFTKLIDAMLYGASDGTGKMMFIISKENSKIKAAIMHNIERGITELKSRGGYSNIDGEVLLCAVRRQEVYKIYDIVNQLDPYAFIIVGDAGEIRGEGFKEEKD